eukprot:6200997-Pleurochrysis_carterae.AAC.2
MSLHGAYTQQTIEDCSARLFFDQLNFLTIPADIPECKQLLKEQTWRDRRKQALQAYADETYGDGGKPFGLVSKANHSAIKECSRCKTLRLAVAKLIRENARSDAIAAAKAEQKKHSDWFLGQLNELQIMRQSGLSN